MKHEYLIELLKQNKTVILPNIGAFSNNDNAKQPFLFNEFLKFNDGMVAKHISSKEGISMDAAGDTVEKFTNELKEILAEGKEVVIPGIGTLHKKDGKTILIHGTITSSTPVTEKKQEPIIEKKPEPVIEKKSEPIPEKKIEPVIEKKQEPVLEKKPETIVEKLIPTVI
jgi:nucleoid DNA-binding protein